MEIQDAQLTNYCNEGLRPLADSLTRVDVLLPVLIAQYNARNLGTIINDLGANKLITDGSELDGRTRRVGGDVYNLVTLMQDLKTFLDAPGRRDVLNGWQVNGIK